MKKKLFDKGIMLDGLVQLKVTGIIFLILSLLATILPALFYGINNSNIYENPININNFTTFLIPLMYIAPFTFCIILFGFLNNRRGSDFFHSLPQTRSCLFISYTVSILIWLAVMIIPSVLLSAFTYKIFGASFSASYIPYSIFTLLAGAFLVTACMLLAMSITGTVFTNIILFGLILFLPRLFTVIYTVFLTTNVPIITSNEICGLLSVNCNIPVKFIVNLFQGTLHLDGTSVADGNQLFTSVSAIIYTLVIAAIYFAAACLIFRKRKSEIAGSSAPNRIMQHVYRCAITLPVTLMIPFVILSQTLIYHTSWQINLQYVITLIIISLIIYYLFELLTTKKLKNLLYATPVLAVIIVIDAAFGFSLNTARTNILNFSPTTADIESISFMPNVSRYSYESAKYNDLITKTIEFKDEQIKSNVAQILNTNIKQLKNNQDLYTGAGTTVAIRLKNGETAQRNLYLTANQNSNFENLKLSNTDYIKLSTSLPTQSSISQIYLSYSYKNINYKKIWESYKSEYNNLSNSDKISLNNHASYPITDSLAIIDSFYIQGNIDGSNYLNNFLITPKTPKTALMVMNLHNSVYKSDTMKILTSGNIHLCFNITLYNNPYSRNKNASALLYSTDMSNLNSKKKAKAEQVIKVVASQSNESIDMTKPFIQIEAHINESNSYQDNYYYQPLSEENIKAILALKK